MPTGFLPAPSPRGRAAAPPVDRDRVGRPHSGRLKGGGTMDKTILELLARRAGLDKAMAQFPDDVAAAAEQAESAAARMKAPSDPRAEPWPPMRAGSGL